MEIIVCDESHIPQLTALENECFGTPWTADNFTSSMQAGHRFFGAVENGLIVGYCGVLSVSGEAYIDNIAVTKDCRRQGIAKKLLETVKDCCRCENDEFLTLEVRESNTAARSLYEKIGFDFIGFRRNFYTRPTENAALYKMVFGD